MRKRPILHSIYTFFSGIVLVPIFAIQLYEHARELLLSNFSYDVAALFAKGLGAALCIFIPAVIVALWFGRRWSWFVAQGAQVVCLLDVIDASLSLHLRPPFSVIKAVYSRGSEYTVYGVLFSVLLIMSWFAYLCTFKLRTWFRLESYSFHAVSVRLIATILLLSTLWFGFPWYFWGVLKDRCETASVTERQLKDPSRCLELFGIKAD